MECMVTPTATLGIAYHQAEGRMTMGAVKRRMENMQRPIPRGAELRASSHVGLSPRMILPRLWRAPLTFPFDKEACYFFYSARNGLYALAKQWNFAGREVLFPAYFEGVECDVLLQAGARLRFYPVHDRMRVELDDVLSRIGPETYAVYLIHYLGFPGPVDELAEVCRERKLLLVEDCAQALLSRLGDRPLGSFGDAAIFSIYKTLAVPHGGALVLCRGSLHQVPQLRSPALASTLAYAFALLSLHFEVSGATWGKSLLKWMKTATRGPVRATGGERVPVGSTHFDPSHTDLGMSRISELVISNQNFSLIVDRRRCNFLRLLGRLQDISPPVFDSLPAGVCPLGYPFDVGSTETRDKELVVQKLLARGVEAVNFWRTDHSALPSGTYPEVDGLRRRILQLPCHQDLTSRAVDWVAERVCEVMEELNSSKCC